MYQAGLFEFHPGHRSLKDFKRRSDRARCAPEARSRRRAAWGRSNWQEIGDCELRPALEGDVERRRLWEKGLLFTLIFHC